MIRTLHFSQELASIMTDGYATCDAAMAALTMYFREQVYGTTQKTFKHVAAIDMDVMAIMYSAIEADDPHLKGIVKVEVLRANPEDMTADLIVTIDDIYMDMLHNQQGINLCH